MSIRPLFDVNNNIILPTIVLCSRNKHKLGTIFPVGDFEITPDIHGTNECSFKVYKEVDGVKNPLWSEIKDLKLIYMPEYNEYFQIAIDKESSNKTVKSIVAENLGVAELSQTMLYDIEINTEDDIARDDYTVAEVYNPGRPESSLLGRILSKAPHYKIKHVDDSLAKLVRSFSADNKSIYDFLTGDLADELNCLVIAGSDRTVSLYDLEDTCIDCGCRDDDISSSCPKCGSKNIKTGYGHNTHIYISTDNLSESISVDGNSDEIKNTFRVRGGDDLINAAVRAINPNGTEYINRFSDFARQDMPKELTDKIDSYQELYESKMPAYRDAMTKIYYAIDKILYYTSEMMPSPETSDTNAESELKKLISANIGSIAVQNLHTAGEITVNNMIKRVIQIFMSPGYKADICSSTYSYSSTDSYGVWKGKFEVQSIDDESDSAVSKSDITLTITEDYKTSIEQKLKMSLAKDNVDATKTYDWTLYSLNRLSSFSDAYQTCLDILIEIGAGEPSHEFYDSIYVPYYNEKLAIDAQILVREAEIKTKESAKKANEITRDAIQKELNFEKYLGKELYLAYCSYRREDTYRNDNYVSDGLSNSELLAKAEELLETAQKELYKASELQYTISTSIGNLFAIKEFEPLKSQFQVGNWIRVCIDDEIFKLRLIDYTIKDTDISKLQCNFSSVTKIHNGTTDVKSILANAKSMSSSYESVKRQSKRGDETSDTVKTWTEKGMDATAVAISDSENQTVVYNGHGILCREYDDTTETYSDEQLKIVNNILAITDDNWKTVKSAIGKIYYEDPEKSGEMLSAYGVLAECLVGKLILGEALGIYNTGGSLKFNTDGLEISNATTTFTVNPNADKLFKITKGTEEETEEILSVDKYGNGSFSGNIYANSGKIGGDNGWNIGTNALYNGCESLTSTNAGTYVGVDGIRQYKDENHYVDIIDGKLKAQNADIEGTIKSSNAHITGGSIHIDTNNYQNTDDDGYIRLKYISDDKKYIISSIMSIGGFKFKKEYSGNNFLTDYTTIDFAQLGEDSFGRLFLLLRHNNTGDSSEFLKFFSNGIEIYIETPVNGFDKTRFDKIKLYNDSATFNVPVYTSDGTISKSDKESKHSVTPLSKKNSADFIYSLTPSQYKLNDGTSDRYHHGFIAQEVKEAMGNDDWGVYVDTSITDSTSQKESFKALRYEELIADLVATVQSQNERITLLENKINKNN